MISVETYHGGLQCCKDTEYCLEHNELEVSEATRREHAKYAEIVPENRPLYLAACCDAFGDLDNMGTLNTMYRIPLYTYTQRASEPEREIELVYAVGQQHRGGLGIEMYDDATGDLLCASVPKYGSGTEAGNEEGYVISMSTCTFDPPRRMKTTDIVRIVGLYNNTLPHTDVMSLMYVALSDLAPKETAAASVTTFSTGTQSPSSAKWTSLVLGAIAGSVICALAMVIVTRWKLRSRYTSLQSQTNLEAG
ncbi:hypothetical protein PHMEG_00023201 [Phytophthora megakarya]|uniref:Uncharacterized protein n=1 Tax=Phytophthora megakarya TaxID=4795 RepID=A0A225VHL5_9STRA|nr:hypothetical protein PHMEG_00023201 [Phytophthora megakarya]